MEDCDFGTADDLRWDPESSEVRFTARIDGKDVVCRVEKAWVLDFYGWGDLDQNECMEAAFSLFDPIIDAMSEMISNINFQDDGSLLLKAPNA